MKKILHSIFFLMFSCFITGQSYSQNMVPNSDDLLDKLRLNKSIGGHKDVSYKDISGTPFIFEDFQTGEVILKTGEKHTADMRYDKYAGEMQFRIKGIVYAIALPEAIDYIEIKGIRFVYSTTNSGSDYMQVLADGKCKLLAEKRVRIQDAEPPKPYQMAKPARFIDLEDLIYLKLADKEAVRINSRKDLLNVLNDKKDQVSQFLKEENLKLSDTEDLKKVIAFYNSL